MLLAIPTIDKQTKIRVLAIHFFLLAASTLLAQNYGQQLDQYFELNNQVIQSLQNQLKLAIWFCCTMGFITLSTIGYFLFDTKIHTWIIDFVIWWDAKKNWLKNKLRF